MKVAFSSVVLGASIMGAYSASLQDGGSVTYANQETLSRSGTGSATQISATNKDGNAIGVSCSPAEGKGTAYVGYTQISDAASHASDATLAFWCGIDVPSEIQNDNGVERYGQSVLVEVSGEKEDCGGVVSGESTGTFDGQRLYKPRVTAGITYNCIKKADSPAKEVTLKLAVQATDNARDAGVVGLQDLEEKIFVTRTSPTKFETTTHVTFNLGTDKPHSAYFKSGVLCEGSGDICRGKITLSADDANSTDLSTALVGNWSSDASVPYYRLVNNAGSTDACSDTVYRSTFTKTEAQLCGMYTELTFGGDGLMTEFKCPFDNVDRIGLKTNTEACLAAGSTTVDNTCAARDDGVGEYNDVDTVDLDAEGFQLKLQFPDMPKTRHFTFDANNLPATASKSYIHGSTRVSYTLDVGNNTGSAKNLKIYVDSASTGTRVDIIDGKITFSVPVSASSVELKGETTSNCNASAEQLLGSTTLASTEEAEKQATGEFRKDDPCDRLFVFTPDDETFTGTVESVFAGGRVVDTAMFCTGSPDAQTEKACVDEAKTNTTGEDNRRADFGDLCQGIAENHIAGLVDFGNGRSAKIICPDICGSQALGDVTLDWSIEFSAGVLDSSNYLNATQSDAAYENATNLTKLQFLSETNQCGADGGVLGDTQGNADCVLPLSNINSAGKLTSRLETCGNYLNQFLVVVDQAGDTFKFCNSKHLSIDVEQMTGETTDAIGVIASTESAGATSIYAEMGTFGYKRCDNGYYKIEAQVIIGALVPLDWTETSPADPDIQWSSFLQGDRIVFNTECQNICSPLSPLDDVYSLGGGLLQSDCTGDRCSALNVAVDIQIKGSPCSESDTVERGNVDLDLYVCGAPDQYEAHADESICAKLTPSDFGDSTLDIIAENLIKTDPNGAQVSVSHEFFKDAVISSGNGVVNDTQNLTLTLDDIFHTYTLTVYWEQKISGSRRLLRTEHVFGAGERQSMNSIKILPVTEQIEDAVESLDTLSDKATEPTESTEPSSDDSDDDDGLSGGAIAGIIAGSVVVVVGIAYVAMQAQGERRRPKAAGYSKVRRNERFSTTNF